MRKPKDSMLKFTHLMVGKEIKSLETFVGRDDRDSTIGFDLNKKTGEKFYA